MLFLTTLLVIWVTMYTCTLPKVDPPFQPGILRIYCKTHLKVFPRLLTTDKCTKPYTDICDSVLLS